MARTKRKVNPVKPELSVQETPKQRVYRTGGYARLSVEDSGRRGADTIENQKQLIKGYIESQPDMEFCGLYCDNGQTGTNFERPSFEKLMEDVRRGKIDCIVVKDLSRFGRNYRETGNYLERIFPFLDVRFVAVSDNFDTLNAERTSDGKPSSDGYIIPLKNIINEAYSRDISKKSGSALAVKQRKGEFIGTWAAYGYKKCADDPHKIEPDTETAPVVQEIFKWRLSGMSNAAIARRLNGQGIPSPSRYHYLKGDASCERYADAVWHGQMVSKILSSEVYLGHMVQGRKRESFHEGKKQQLLPKSEWAIVRNTHKPLIDEESFGLVQEMADSARAKYYESLGKYDNLGKMPNILKGLVYCADCGRPLVRYKSVSHGKKVWYVYICPTHSDNPQDCPKKYMQETELHGIIFDILKKQMQLAAKLSGRVNEFCLSAQSTAFDADLKRRADMAVQSLKRAQTLYESLYPMYAEDKALTEKEYMMMKQEYRSQIERSQKVLEAIEEEKKERRALTVENPWLENCMAFSGAEQLTEELAHALISRIEIDSGNNVSIELRYQDEYRRLARIMETGGKEAEEWKD